MRILVPLLLGLSGLSFLGFGIAFLIASLLLATAAFVAWRFTDAAHLQARTAGEPAA